MIHKQTNLRIALSIFTKNYNNNQKKNESFVSFTTYSHLENMNQSETTKNLRNYYL